MFSSKAAITFSVSSLPKRVKQDVRDAIEVIAVSSLPKRVNGML